MKKILDKQAYRARIAVEMANKGFTWADICERLDVSKITVQRALHIHYAKSGGADSTRYKKLCKLLRENAKSASVAEPVMHVIETGFVISAGTEKVESLMKEGDVVIPRFCVSELEKLTKRYTVAEEFFMKKLDEKVVKLSMKHEVLIVEPEEPVTPRIKGIVAVVADLYSLGKEVKLHTNSIKVKELAEKQGGDIEVDLVSTKPS